MKTSRIKTTHNRAIIDGWVDPVLGEENPGTVVDPDLENASGVALVEGDVVIVNSAGQITTTTTVGYLGKVGVVQDDIAAGDYGPVAFSGPVDLINVTASVTAGNYARTSATAKKAESAGTSPASGSFGQFTSTGTSPSGFLFGGVAAGVYALSDLTDVTITSPAALHRLHYTGTEWVNTAAIWRPLMDGAGAVITDGATGEAIMALQ